MKTWEEFEKWLNSGNIPKQLESLKDIPLFDNWLHQIRQATGVQATARKEGVRKSYQIKENKDQLEVTYELPANYDAADIVLFVREDYVKIEGLPEQQIELIKLPKLVKASVCKSKIQDDILIIRLTKRPRPIKFYRYTISN